MRADRDRALREQQQMNGDAYQSAPAMTAAKLRVLEEGAKAQRTNDRRDTRFISPVTLRASRMGRRLRFVQSHRAPKSLRLGDRALPTIEHRLGDRNRELREQRNE
jgi:hypothetical protein